MSVSHRVAAAPWESASEVLSSSRFSTNVNASKGGIQSTVEAHQKAHQTQSNMNCDGALYCIVCHNLFCDDALANFEGDNHHVAFLDICGDRCVNRSDNCGTSGALSALYVAASPHMDPKWSMPECPDGDHPQIMAKRRPGHSYSTCLDGIDMRQIKILLPSAVHLEERLTVSQSVPEPASRQSVRYTQFGFFVSGRCGPKQQGGPALQPKPGRVVKQPTATSRSAVRTPVWPLWRRRRRRR